MKIMLATLFAVLGSSPFVFANWQDWSVWKSNQVAENSIIGKVKTIATDEESDRIIVKVKAADGSIQVATLCDEGVQSARNHVGVSPKQALLSDAMANGAQVQLSYPSQFDRCIQDVKVNAPEASSPIQKASAQTQQI